MALKCPFCQGTKSTVVDSRQDGYGVMRRRECSGCNKRYTTKEMTELDLATMRQEAMGVGLRIQQELAILGKRCEKLMNMLKEGETGAQNKGREG